MIVAGCERLNDYLVINPTELQKLEICQTPSRLKAAAPSLVRVGEEKAKAGNVEDAIATFKIAFKWNPELKFDANQKAKEFENKGKAEDLVNKGERLAKENDIDNAVTNFQSTLKLDPDLDIKPQQKAQRLATEGLVSKAGNLVSDKKINDAIATYNQAQKLDAEVEIDADAWSNLCWQGTLNKSAFMVMFACDKSVKLAPNDGQIRTRRGIARALTGNYKGAILDLEAYIQETDDKKSKAQVHSLGKNSTHG